MTLAELLTRTHPIVLDGGLATELEAQGHDLTDGLWSARLLRDDPGAIEEAHAAYLRAGSQVSITASYQASVEAFARAGMSAHGAEEMLTRSVELARSARRRSQRRRRRPRTRWSPPRSVRTARSSARGRSTRATTASSTRRASRRSTSAACEC